MLIHAPFQCDLRLPFFLAFDAASDEAYVAYMDRLEDWQMSQAEIAMDMLEFLPGTGPRTMTKDEVHQFSRVRKNIYLSKLCRNQSCLFFGGNNVDTWIRSRTGFGDRCPMCGREWRPWKRPDASDVPATRVLTLRNPLTGEWMHIPTRLSGSQNLRLINDLIEVTARDMQNESEWEQWNQEIKGDVQGWLARETTCEAWSKFPYCRSSHLSHKDRSAWDDTRQMKNKYVMGLKLTDVEAARQPFEDWDTLFREWTDNVFRGIPDTMKILVAMPDDRLFELNLTRNSIVFELKFKIQGLRGIPIDEQCISFAEHENLEDGYQLRYYSVQHLATVRLTRRVALR